jgi:hypothetical protein
LKAEEEEEEEEEEVIVEHTSKGITRTPRADSFLVTHPHTHTAG